MARSVMATEVRGEGRAKKGSEVRADSRSLSRSCHAAQVLAYAGLFYLAKLSVCLACDLWDGVRSYLLPMLWTKNLPR